MLVCHFQGTMVKENRAIILVIGEQGGTKSRKLTM
jgi:hypothetical protein